MALDAQLDALLAEMGSTPEATAEDPKTPEAPIAEPADVVAAPVESASDAAEAAVASIEQQVESLVDQFVDASNANAEPVDPAPIPAEEPAPMLRVPEVKGRAETSKVPAQPQAVPETISALDEQLANLTDELLTSPVAAAPASSVPQVVEPQAAVAPAPVEAAVPVAEPTRPVAMPKEPATKPLEVPAPVVAEPADVVVRPSKVAAILAKPLQGKPRMVRDTVGWLGLNSIFLAGVVWTYHLAFQRPEPIHAQRAPAGLVGVHNEQADAHASHNLHNPHAPNPAPADAHAATEHHASIDAHGDSHAAAGEHGASNAHGTEPEAPLTGAQPLVKKKPTYALSEVMAAKLGVAKKTDDKGGHGGGGGHGSSGGGHGEAAKPKGGH